ncbi:MAG: S46 family peptidase [Marinilabiliales bacterium]|nr:S46 family peptidase [Marinilabiliales bacterium]
MSRVTKAMIRLYKADIDPKFRPDFYALIDKKFKGNVDAFVDDMFARSIFTSPEKLKAFLASSPA